MRNFTEATYRELARKPRTIEEAKTCRLHGTNPDTLELVSLARVTIPKLNKLVQQRGELGSTDFAVYDQDSENVFLVNTEGYEYARYVGRLTAKDARELIEVKAAEGQLVDEKAKPAMEFSGFDEMPEAVYEAYQGCQGDATIAFFADPTDQAVWQIDFVVDEACIQLHFNAMAGYEAAWSTNLPVRRLAQELGAAVASALLREGLNPLDAPDLDLLDNLFDTFGFQRV